MSGQPRLLDNDMGDNDLKPELAHRFPGIYLIAEKTLENLN